MHDIGKIAIPDSVLLKPGRLTDEEFDLMKTHSMKGCEILESIDYTQDPQYYKYCYEICRWHHERWDGKGYPDRLKGDEIPIWAQVTSIADVYDALTSKRVYKDAYTHDEAIRMILDGECGQFNPKLIEALLRVKDRLEELLLKTNLDIR
jgi:putative two-component system response regulator